ncbi:hypothetical protein D4L85_31070 [Chryseolinea soli]|uniref:Uncharacterized protein n=1 Tax=Chryseolinea soli TaxID=2321403 RepID=A0A385SSG3_9BACT|nr:hypothetical protein D4L85_31070 [Chryseolinea soli]
MKYYFDKSVPNNNTTCRSIKLDARHSHLDYLIKKVKGDFPLYDANTGIYHTDKIAAIIVPVDSNKMKFGVTYFYYKDRKAFRKFK